jgi:hypothetical protein
VAQQRVIDALTAAGERVIINDRQVISPQEIDILLPDRGIGIEVNGCYWHTEADTRPADYHLRKSERAAAAGIRLIHIFDDEIEPMLERILQVLRPPAIGARETHAVEVARSEARQFLERYHSAGAGPGAKHYVGLRSQSEELLAVASFGKNRWGQVAEWELIRMAFSARVSGGAGKLFRFWVKQVGPKSVLTYSERRWSLNDSVYSRLGFVLDGATPPDYWYVGNETRWVRVPRQKYQAHRMRIGPEDKRSERELAAARGLHRVYGCGNLRWIWRAS